MGLDKGDKLKIANTIGSIEVQKIIGPGTGQSATYQSFWDGQVGAFPSLVLILLIIPACPFPVPHSSFPF